MPMRYGKNHNFFTTITFCAARKNTVSTSFGTFPKWHLFMASTIDKILGRVVYNRLYTFLEKKQPIYSCHFGFRQKHSTIHALINLTIPRVKEWCFTQFTTGMAGWLLLIFLMFTQSIKFYTFYYQYICLKNVIHQKDSKNRWLLLSASFTAKFGLVYVLTLEKAFS